MVKKLQPKDLKLKPAFEAVQKVGGRLADIITVAASHPASLALALMCISVGLKLILAGDESTTQKKRIGNELGGLYAGAQGSLVALAAAPIIAQGLGTLTEALKKSPT